MMEALRRFPQIGWIGDYLALPPGERALAEQFTLFDLRNPSVKL